MLEIASFAFAIALVCLLVLVSQPVRHLALGAVSFSDDLFGLPALLRFFAHLAAAAAALLLIIPNPDPVLFVALLLGIGWLTNLFNFMDGSDGLAGGMAVAGFGHRNTALAEYVLMAACAAAAVAARHASPEIQAVPTPHPKLRVAKVRSPESAQLLEGVIAWLSSGEETTDVEVRARLRRWIPEYGAPDPDEAQGRMR